MLVHAKFLKLRLEGIVSKLSEDVTNVSDLPYFTKISITYHIIVGVEIHYLNFFR